jgi:hypothetical protein
VVAAAQNPTHILHLPMDLSSTTPRLSPHPRLDRLYREAFPQEGHRSSGLDRSVRFHKLTVPWALPVARLWPSGAIAADSAATLWSVRGFSRWWDQA